MTIRFDRLQTLAQRLRSLPAGGNVSLEAWLTGEEEPCGTIACALGWACLLPEFVRDGLHLDGFTPCYRPPGSRWVSTSATGYEAGEKFFGLSACQAADIFECRENSCYDYAENGEAFGATDMDDRELAIHRTRRSQVTTIRTPSYRILAKSEVL
ncbi:hypothetical protein [Cupriavidus metallidurans]|uniref:hypothetical protein n=1 Tax=Cupriavidus metallidurans TaxID=119219 RepID=UPI001CCE9FE6|nr:hypothetical protein [Cupriavidus metallidurans]UBM12794.1 hypothetical protein LAI70_27970 [Cupriavidus metallidurans]